ncbi:hypothetical protein [Paenibacillus polymyxa]|uniref:Uncharacterized protein n=1 Tax=Paenibacillus polymyxa (strain SC2) TaxID=886882 RepID=E3EJN9_PAEPS|nr:hypothetical protein [Paenibacillus polymyxa]ADO59637.1 hypothetical protein PPSC2_26950 [Paenibacillus polymyxa SC2]WPQ59537.1 hypothetical protein SKN87_28145 [Paenibacillus polymyxa]
MKNKSVHITYQVVREIFTSEIEKDIVAFQDVTQIEGKEDLVSEGISTLEKIASVNNDKVVPIMEKLCLFKKGVVEAHKEENIFVDSTRYNQFYIPKPFSYIQEFGMEGAVLLKSEGYSHNLYTLDGDRLMHPIHFDDIYEEYYDLYAIIAALNKRDDIRWKKSKWNNSYFVSTLGGKRLEFRYLPTNGIWDEIKYIKNSFDVRDYLKKEVLGISKFAKDI